MSSVRQPNTILFGAVLTIGLLVIFYVSGWLRPLEYWLSTAVQPGFHLFYAVLDTLSPLYSTTDSTLLAENVALKDALAKVVRENNDVRTQLIQYQEYEEQLAFAREKNYTITPAKIISRIGQSDVSQVILINRGSNHGVAVGYPVMYGTGIMLGTVTSVHEAHAEVTPLTHETSQVQGMVQGRAEQTAGIIRGQFGTSLQFEYILKDQPLASGDIIISNGQDRFIPAGLVIGTVQNVTETPSDLFKSASLTPLVRYGNNAIVSVIIPKL